jgi:hypothetical protein
MAGRKGLITLGWMVMVMAMAVMMEGGEGKREEWEKR